MLAKLYDALTIFVVLVGVVAIILAVIYREVLFKPLVNEKPAEQTHEFLQKSKLKIDSRWLSDSVSIRDKSIFIPKDSNANVFAAGLNKPQLLKVISNGSSDLVVLTEKTTGNIVVFSDLDKDGSADSKIIFKSGLEEPYGIDFLNNNLYVGVKSQVLVFENFLEQLKEQTSNFSVLVSNIPQSSKSGLPIKVANNGVFVGVSASCNYCIEVDKRRGSVLLYSLSGGGEQIYSSGFKNINYIGTVLGQTFVSEQSFSGERVFDEVNSLKPQSFYGWPYYFNNGEVFTDFTANPPLGLNPVNPLYLLENSFNPAGFVILDSGLGLQNAFVLSSIGKSKLVYTNAFNQSEFNDLFVFERNAPFTPIGVAQYHDGLLIADEANGSIYYLR